MRNLTFTKRRGAGIRRMTTPIAIVAVNIPHRVITFCSRHVASNLTTARWRRRYCIPRLRRGQYKQGGGYCRWGKLIMIGKEIQNFVRRHGGSQSNLRKEEISHLGVPCTIKEEAVSYTHLDVYKRQI